MFSDTDTLLDDVRAELLHRESTHIARELSDDSVTEAIVVEIEDVLDNLRKCFRIPYRGK